MNHNTSFQQQLLQQLHQPGGGSNPGGVGAAGQGNNSPSYPAEASLMGSKFWQKQMQLAQLSRQTGPTSHGYARAAAINSRQQHGRDGGPGPVDADKDQGPSQLTLVDLAVQTVQQDLVEQQQAAAATTPQRGYTNQQKKDQLEEERQMTLMQQEKHQYWADLDMSGQGLMCLSPPLFRSYEFLLKLYINHNKLTTLPPAIRSLRQLRVLDVSSNMLTKLPPEIGMLHNLRYLFAFDNYLSTLPHQVGQLYQLEVIGLEGNPINQPIKEKLAQGGTKELVAELRESAPMPAAPKPREWIVLEEAGGRGGAAASSTAAAAADGESGSTVATATAGSNAAAAGASASSDTFTVMSYNTLCDKYTTVQMHGYTPLWALGWKHRSDTLLKEVIGYDSDILCFQEVDGASFEDFWSPKLHQLGYAGLYHPKTRARTMSKEKDAKRVDGCAIFYKTKSFCLIEKLSLDFSSLALKNNDFKKTADTYNRVLNKDNIALIALLEHVTTGQKIIVTNTHLHWDPAFNDVKLIQVALLLDEVEKFAERVAKDSNRVSARNQVGNSVKYESGKKLPLVICGDFNSTTDSGVYSLFSQGNVTNHKDMSGRAYGKFTDEGMNHGFTLKSAYSNIGELAFTNYTPNFVDVIDYVWYSSNALSVRGLLGGIDPDYTSNMVGFPSVHYPSDHISLLAEFSFKKQKGGDGQVKKALDFGNSGGHSGSRKT